MCKVLENSLFVKDKKKYKVITECVTRFNSLYNKNNIIRKLLLIFADDVGGMVFAAVIHENCFEIRKRFVDQYGIQTAA